MTPLLAIATLLQVAAITPGPNNLVVLRAAAHGGIVHALPAVLGVVLGSIALLAIAAAGFGAAFASWPGLRLAVAAGGALYLVWLGGNLALARDGSRAAAMLPAGVRGLFGFQFLNPKGWVMTLTAVAALPAGDAIGRFLYLAPLFVVIPACCLLLWAALGRAMARHLARPMVRLWTDRVLGALLVASALLLLA